MQLSKDEVFDDPIGWYAHPICTISGIANVGLYEEHLRSLPVISELPFDSSKYSLLGSKFKFKMHLEEDVKSDDSSNNSDSN